ncbi:MAG: CheR family methyltransferase [Gammaproteobacteria bacterium]
MARTAANDTEDTLGREFAFSDSDFAFIRQMVEQHAAIKLPDSKRQMVYGRLVRRLRELRLGSFAEYVALLRDDPGGPEFVNLINAVTTNLTSFFRERHHFEVLEDKVLPELQQRNAANRRIRVWSAGCSTGEEPYSIAITLRGSSLLSQGWDARVLATDIDTKVLATAEAGVYGIDRIRDLPEDLKRRGFLRGRGDASQRVRVRREMQELITFRQLNLMEPWPMRHRFDVIFCRNVVIYFDKPTQGRLFDRFADQLNDGGYVFLGHSETMHNLTTRFRLLGQTVYQKVQ